MDCNSFFYVIIGKNSEVHYEMDAILYPVSWKKFKELYFVRLVGSVVC